MKIYADYHVYSKLGSYSTPHVINIYDVYSLINVCQREKEGGGGGKENDRAHISFRLWGFVHHLYHRRPPGGGVPS